MPPDIEQPPADLAAPPPDAERHQSGTLSVVLNHGHGDTHGDTDDLFVIHFAAWKSDGELLETTLEPRGEGPYACRVDRCVPDGAGLLTMVEGETRRLWIPGSTDPAVIDVQLLAILPNPAPAPADVQGIPTSAAISASGVGSRVLRAGYGAEHPTQNSTVRVVYAGWTTDGRVFDAAATRGRDMRFPLSRVIPGFSEGVQQMVVGERRRVWIPEDLAYEGRPGPPAGMLVFDIMLLQIVDTP